jgi:TetR/AcrR family transcriptional regulator, transcriptional repressor for nem operon
VSVPMKERRTKRAYDPKGTRGRILDAAANEFQLRGYHATSVHDIMRIAQVPGGSVYHYFPTKKSLALAVIEERVAESLAETWIEPLRKAPSASQGILSVFDAVAKSISDRAVLGCPVTNLALELSLADPDFQNALRAAFERWEKAIAERLQEQQVGQKRKAVDPTGLATLVVAVFSGAMSLAKAAQSAAPLRTCRREIVRLLP